MLNRAISASAGPEAERCAGCIELVVDGAARARRAGGVEVVAAFAEAATVSGQKVIDQAPCGYAWSARRRAAQGSQGCRITEACIGTKIGNFGCVNHPNRGGGGRIVGRHAGA